MDEIYYEQFESSLHGLQSRLPVFLWQERGSGFFPYDGLDLKMWGTPKTTGGLGARYPRIRTRGIMQRFRFQTVFSFFHLFLVRRISLLS